MLSAALLIKTIQTAVISYIFQKIIFLKQTYRFLKKVRLEDFKNNNKILVLLCSTLHAFDGTKNAPNTVTGELFFNLLFIYLFFHFFFSSFFCEKSKLNVITVFFLIEVI